MLGTLEQLAVPSISLDDQQYWRECKSQAQAVCLVPFYLKLGTSWP